MTSAAYEEETRRLNAALRPFLTEEWLATAVIAARTYGWNGDYIEVVNFLDWLHQIAGREFDSIEPFQA